MDSLLNSDRSPVFCPGCAHDKVLHTLDKALSGMGYEGREVVIVTDIGCCGLFDLFFDTHAFHGLHGRALTYATGIKMARPELEVIVIMGDGGLGIGGAHVLSTCRRNIDVTLLVLNNFNYGMTGGQCSPTTPQDAVVGSGFLNRLEKPLDICQVAGAAGAGFLARLSTYDKTLEKQLVAAVKFDGFALVDIWGICPGRYKRHNKLSPESIRADLAKLPSVDQFISQNAGMEYVQAYQKEVQNLQPAPEPVVIPATCKAPESGRREVVILGSAGQRIITAGELLCLAGAAAGCHVTQKNDYPITVMRGHSVSELILSDCKIDYTGIENPSVVIALASEGIKRRETKFHQLAPGCLVIKAAGIDLPPSRATIMEVDFTVRNIKPADWALAALAVLAGQDKVLSMDMLRAAMGFRFEKEVLDKASAVVDKAATLSAA
jgi:pyruvate/2-oxoacid:ferredoxin oxidoreductase beta subunit/Pyruvate/2-oxoacid:ferredoxin oxidoreductase gamma subunit